MREPAKTALIQLMDDMIERQPHRANFMERYKSRVVEGSVLEAARVSFMLQIPAEQDGVTHDLGQIRNQVLGELRTAQHHDVAKLCKGWRREFRELIESVDQAHRDILSGKEFAHYLNGIESRFGDATINTIRTDALIQLSGLTPQQTKKLFDYNQRQGELRSQPAKAKGLAALAAALS